MGYFGFAIFYSNQERKELKKSILGTLFVLVFATSVISCAGPEAKKAKYKAKAEQFMTESNWPKARISLQNVLKIDPKDAEGYYMMGEVEEKEENLKNAVGDYFKAVELKPDYQEALIKVGRYYLLAHDFTNVEETAERILKKDPGNPSAETFKSVILYLRGNQKMALKSAEKAAVLHPFANDLISFLSSLYIQSGNLQKAEKVLKRGIGGNPDSIILLSSLAEVQIKQGQRDEAEKSLKKIIEIEPKDLKHQIQLAVYYDQNNSYRNAEEVLTQIVRNDSQSEKGYLALSQFYLQHQKNQEAEAVLRKGMDLLPKSVNIVFTLGRHYEIQNEQAKARAIYEKVIQDKKTEGSIQEAEARLASLDFLEGHLKEGEERIDSILRKNPESEEALTFKGKILLQRKEYFEAIQHFRTALKGQPERADLLALLGEAYLKAGELDLAKDSLDQSLKLNPQLWSSRYYEALVEAGKGRTESAEKELTELLKVRSGDSLILGSLMEIEMAKKDWVGSEKTMDQIRRSAKDPFLIAMSEANLALEEKRISKARASYGEAFRLRPEASEPLFAMVRLDLSMGKKNEVKAFLQKTFLEQPKNSYAHHLYGEILLAEKEKEKAEKEFYKATQLKGDWSSPWLKLIFLKLSDKNLSMALNYLNMGIELNPGSQELYLLKGTVLAESGKTDEAVTAYKRLIQINPSNKMAQNNLAMLLVDKKGDPTSLNQALNLMQEYATGETRDPVLLDTLGWVYHKMGREEEAINVLGKALASLPNQETINYHMGMIYYKTGRFPEAKKYLTKAVQVQKPFSGQEDAKKVLSQLNG
jgi:tetratricopeptide (TPR) repeat protein